MSRNLVVLYISTITILLAVSLFIGCYALILSLNYSFRNTSLTYLHEPTGLTEQEVIEISRNSSIVQACLNRGEFPYCYAEYWNSAYVMFLKENPTMRERLQTDNGVWKVYWAFSLVVDNRTSFTLRFITHYIDEMTREILYQLHLPLG